MKGPIPSTPSGAPVETKKMEENRMLQEAMDVMQKQTEEYEKEIRSLKDKSRPTRSNVRTAGGSRATPKSSSMDLEATLNQLGQASGSKPPGSTSRDVLLESVSLESALFRPALSSAVQSSIYWKSKAMESALSKLAPLNVSTGNKARKALDNLFSLRGNDETNGLDCMNEIAMAMSEVRLVNASFSIVDLSKNDVPAREQLSCEKQKKRMAEQRLLNAASCFSAKTDYDSPLSSRLETREATVIGRITLPCRDGMGYVVPMTVTSADLRNLHSFLVQ